MEKRFDILILSVITLIMASGCQENDTVYSGERLCTVQASFGDNTTRVGLVQDANSRDMITKWQEDDRINVILMKGTEYIDLGTVPIHDISENGKNCVFQYALPDDFDASEGYRLSCFTNNCKPVIIDGDVFYNASLIRLPISEFKARVMFDEYVQEENCFGSFLHYGTYELFHITNKSDKSINFSLGSFEADKCWYKETGGIRLYDNEFVVDNRFEKIIQSPSVTIPANSSDIIVSWYIPNGWKIQNARIVAEIDGEYVHSTNTKSSNVTLCTGVAYHMYATWDGNELKWGKGEDADQPVEVDYVEGICSDFYPENNAILESCNGSSLSCLVTFPWNGTMVMEICISEQPSMTPMTKAARISLTGSYGTVNSGCSTFYDGLEANKKYYWQVNYFDFESECFKRCSPIMSFTTGSD